MRHQALATAELAVKKGFTAEIKSSADELDGKLTELENLLINNKMQSGQDPIGMERRLSNRMGRLYQVVREHDAGPTGGMKERFADLQQDYDRCMKSYNELISKDLARFNDFLKKEGVGHILIP